MKQTKIAKVRKQIILCYAFVILVLLVSMAAGCSPKLKPAPLPDLNGVQTVLGYALAPERMPEGFEFNLYEVNESDGVPVAMLVYHELNHHIFIEYPRSLAPSGKESPLWKLFGLDWQRPEDAVCTVDVNGELAYLVRGRWSADTLRQLENPNPELIPNFFSEWDYNVSLSLYFEYELSDGNRIDVRIVTMFSPNEWIATDELVNIAESLRELE